MGEKTKNAIIALLIVGLVSMTVAYAALSQTIFINSSAKVLNKSALWNVHFDTPVAGTPVGYASVATGKGLVKANATTLSGLEVTLRAPGDSMSYTFNVVNDGTINIKATDDGINTSNKSDDYDILLEINGGTITVSVSEGDTDCIDSNGNIIVNGGTINLNGNSTWDYDGEATYNGGTIIENGVETNSVKNSMMMGGQGEEPPRR